MKNKSDIESKVGSVLWKCRSLTQLNNAITWCNLLLKKLSSDDSPYYSTTWHLVNKIIIVQEYRLDTKLRGAIINIYGTELPNEK